MTTYRTGNAIGSADPRDLYDNAENLDELVNSQDKLSHPDRLGVPRKTWHGMEQDFQSFLQSSGYQDLGDYAPGIEITAHNQYVTFGGQPYLLKPSIPVPYTTSGEWTGEDFKLIGDDSLRQDLANPDKGGDLVKVTTSTGEQTLVEALDDRAPLEDLESKVTRVSSVSEGFSGVEGVSGSLYLAVCWHEGTEKGGGKFVFRSSQSKSTHNGVTVISPTVPPVSAQTGSDSEKRDAFLSGTGETDGSGSGCFVLTDPVTASRCGMFLNGTADDSGALSSYLALTPKNEFIGGSLLIASPQTLGNNHLKFLDCGIISETDSLFSIDPATTNLSFRGLSYLEFSGFSGAGTYRAITGVDISAVKRLNISDNNFGVGRVFIESASDVSSKVTIKGNKWESDSSLYLDVSSLLVGLGSSRAARSLNTGLVITENEMDLYGPSTDNFDCLKVSGNTYGGRVYSNIFKNKNPNCAMETDFYYGGNHLSVFENEYENVLLKSQEWENAYPDDDSFVTIRNNKFLITEDFLVGDIYVILRKGNNFDIFGNKIRREWPSGGATQDQRCIWVQTTTLSPGDSIPEPNKFTVGFNEVECDYSAANGFNVYPISFTGRADEQDGIISGNRCYGGSDIFSPNSTIKHCIFTSNIWRGSAGSVPSPYIDDTSIDSNNIWNGVAS